MRFIHLGDIHIKNYSNIEEYDKFLDNLCLSLKENDIKKPDRIVIVGDIFHSKTILSGNSILYAIKFFQKLTSFTDVDVIDGNHDINLSNKDRMSSLEAVVKILNNDNLHYYKKSGIYDIGNNHYYGVFSILDKEEDYPVHIENKNENGTYIALYHGALFGNMNEDGYRIEAHRNPNELFKEYDYAFLADIHKRQFLGNFYLKEREIDESEIQLYNKEIGFKIIE